jgi:hypothetical protein
MPEKEKIGELVRRGVLLFAQAVPFPSSTLVAAIGAAVVSKIVDLRRKRISEILSSELTLNHISYVEPHKKALLDFYGRNPLYPELAGEFAPEIKAQDIGRLRAVYPYLYSALVLKRKVPVIFFHQEMEHKKYREMAEKYERIAEGFEGIQGDAKLRDQINHFGGELLQVINEAYEAAKGELKTKDREFAFDIIDYIREVVS